MKSFKVTGTPGEPVRLDTLAVGGYVTSKSQPNPAGSLLWPAQISGHIDDEVRLLAPLGDHDFWIGSFLVHPLTRHVLDDGTVEYRHVGEEVKCRDPRDVEHSLDVIGSAIDDIYSRLAVLESTTGKTTACNGTAVKPAPEPEPTYLERLPEAVRVAVCDRYPYSGRVIACADRDREALARTIFEHRDAIFAAGEPVDSAKVYDRDNDSFGLMQSPDHRYAILLTTTDGGCFVSADDFTNLARRGVAIALASKGGAQ